MKKALKAIISMVLAMAVIFGVMPISAMATETTSGLIDVHVVDCFGGMAEATNKNGADYVGTCTRSTAIEGYVSDYNGNVKRLQTASGIKRALVIEGKSTSTKFPTALKPGMELHIDYKYVPSENSTTDTQALLTKKPGLIISNPSTNSGAIIEAKETLVSGEWATAVFEIGKYFDISNENVLTKFRYAPLSFHATGAESGVTLDIEKQTAINVDSDDYVDIGNLILKIKTATISFDLNGGKSDGSSSVDDYLYKGDIVYPTAPEKEGYIFKGWSLSKASNATIDTKVWAPSEDCTLYAQYGEKNIVDLKSIDGVSAVMGMLKDGDKVQGGTYTRGIEDSIACTIIHSDETSKIFVATDCWEMKNRMPVAVRSGMRLAITYKYVQAQNSNSSSNITEQNPTIRVTSNNGNATITSTEKVVIGEWAKVYFDLSQIASETQEVYISQLHMMPLGRAASGAAEGTELYSSGLPSVHIDPDDTLFVGDVTMALKYDYLVTLDANGGGSGDKYEYVTIASGGAKLEGKKPIRVGYEFMGWAESATATENDVLTAPYMPTADTTLYAVWKEDPASELDTLAVVYPQSGERSTLTSGQKVFSDSDKVINSTLPNYLKGKEFNFDSSTAEKTIWFLDEGYIYIMTPEKGLEGSDAENLEELGFDTIGEYELISGTAYSIYGKFFEGKGKADSKFTIGANTVVIADVAYPDDSLKVPTIIKNVEDNLEQHPEYAELLNGNRKFGGCPSITQTKDGTVWLSITSGGTGEDMYNYAALYKSTDGGRTFGEFVLVADPDTPVRTSEPYVWCAPDGELFFWWSQMFVVPGGGNSDGRMGIFMMRSKDNGNTWTEPKRICDGFANQNPIVLKDGSYALPVNIWNNNGKHSDLNNKKCPTLYISTDKGENWTYAGGAKDSNSGCSDSWFYENSVIEYDDGTLAMYYRTIAGKVGVITSTNKGETWSAEIDSEISYTSARTASIRLKDGTTVFVSHNQELAQGARTHLTVWLGKMDTQKGIITKDDEFMLHLDDVGFYPSIYEGNDGFLYIAYDKIRISGGSAMMAKITVEDIKAGKLVTEGSFLRHLAFKGDYEELPQATVSFDTKGGEEISPLTFRTKNDDFTLVYEVRTLPAAVKKGYKFVSWATEDGGEVVYKALDNYTPATLSDQTFYAVYEPHDFTDYVPKDPAECGKNATEIATCNHEDCNETDIREIEGTALEHKYDNDCDADCNLCNAPREVDGHKYDNDCDANCNNCGETRQVGDHKYDDDCDTSCNICNAPREVGDHKYDNTCDTDCNICGAPREINHTYDNGCDAQCNVCAHVRLTDEHEYEWVTDKKESCNAEGKKHIECSECGRKIFENTVIPATGKHTYKATTTKATTSKNGSIITKCTVCGKIASKSTIYYANKVKLSTSEYTYNGKAKKPAVTVYDCKGNKLSSSYYTISYATGRKNVGKYKVTVKLKGNYSGTLTAYFTINPKETSVSKLTAGKKSLKVKIKKVSSQVTGYEIQYSTSKKFTSAKTKKVSSYKTTTVTLKSLKAKKTYYVRVRTYKTVGGKKYYSGWSTYKYKKTK